MRKLHFILFISIIAIIFSGNLYAKQGPMKTLLDNGLTIVLEENHSSPVVAFQMWVGVGAAYEDDDEAGSAHLLEHMLFKGTERRKVGEIAREIEASGGRINAYTSHDNTVYHLVVASRYFERGLDIISDAIQHSVLDAKELRKEKEVVLEEIRMGEDNPGIKLYRDLLRVAYSTHPYGRPVIGSESTVKKITRDKLMTFYKRWYVPENMTLVVVGDFDSESALKDIGKAFKDFERRKRPKKNIAKEPEQQVARIRISSMDIGEARIGIAFHIPELSHPDIYALDVLSVIMGEGESSRLYRRLKDKETIVNDISASAMTMKDPGAFIISGSLNGKNAKNMIKGISEVIAEIRNEGISPLELGKAKLILESDFVYERETMDGRARQLGYFDRVAGNLGYERKYLEGISRVTSEDLQRMADKYLKEKNMSVSLLLPGKEYGAIDARDIKESFNTRNFKKRSAIKKGEEITNLKLENGITLLVKENHTNPVVGIYIDFLGGLRFEDKDTNGLGNFVARMLTRGTKSRTAISFAKEVEGMAGSISGFSGQDTTGLSGKFLSRFFDRGIELMADALINPVFPDSEIEKVRMDILSDIKKDNDYLPGYAYRRLRRTIYKRHPYGLPVLGTKETVSGFNREDIKRHYEKITVPGRMVISIVGDIDTGHVAKKIKKLFGRFNHKATPFPSPTLEESQSKVERIKAVRASNQANIVLGFLGTTVNGHDRYPLKVLAEILSGQGGRLFVNLRDKKSLAYAVSAFSSLGIDPGVFALYIGTAPSKKRDAIDGLKHELKRIVNEKVTEEELKRAKGAIIGNYEVGLQRNLSQASEMANNELFGLGYDEFRRYPDKIKAVTREDIQRVAERYINLDSYALSVVGPGKEK